MPLQEQYAYMATGIYCALTAETKKHCFAMPQFMEYLVGTKISPNYEYALFDTILSAEKIYQMAEDNNDDLIIIGNVNKSLKFDKVFNFQDITKDLQYEDKFVEKLKTVVQSEESLVKMLELHNKEEVSLTLHDCIATADFLSKYLSTDPHIEEIEAKYREQLKEIQYGTTSNNKN